MIKRSMMMKKKTIRIKTVMMIYIRIKTRTRMIRIKNLTMKTIKI